MPPHITMNEIKTKIEKEDNSFRVYFPKGIANDIIVKITIGDFKKEIKINVKSGFTETELF